MAMAPYETMSRSGLSLTLANAGDIGEAIAWADRAVINDPNGSQWNYYGLTFAYYLGQRYDDALKALSRYKADFPWLFAVICVRLGRLDEARAAIADALKAGAKLSIAGEGFFPKIEPQRAAYLNDLRAAGVPRTDPIAPDAFSGIVRTGFEPEPVKLALALVRAFCGRGPESLSSWPGLSRP
jgi:tetratricopeptide (TPR) repeat protein